MHAKMLSWFEPCDELCVTRSDAESIWANRLRAILILGAGGG